MKERKAYVLLQQVILIIQIMYYAKTVVALCYSNLFTYFKINVSTYILNWNNFVTCILVHYVIILVHYVIHYVVYYVIIYYVIILVSFIAFKIVS